MTDLRRTIIPKSDQLNADDLIGTTKTIKITKVSLAAGEQPIAINYEGDEGKPYLPCKSMRRVLVNVWGPDGNDFIGRSLTLYRDDKVTWGGVAVGGIRISHMSHIDHDVTMALTATKSSRKPFTVKPLNVQENRSQFITHEQRRQIVTYMGETVKPADLLKKFNVRSSKEIPAELFNDVIAWINGQMEGNPQKIPRPAHFASRRALIHPHVRKTNRVYFNPLAAPGGMIKARTCGSRARP